ncbi:hypothetical protein LRS73_28325 [Methylobacterium currus]|uniref:hypothetical protein n=1 Tax=Methylobacterium currus TaxID=2051553 RepID=UPI001E645086|nr:hypothetical protein [Methylobacterium currus]UHC16312.1 hypothetical protein LRS73_28325 [Methylobacterium currus]
MNTEPTATEIRDGIVNVLVGATMPDGSPISSRVKTDTMLDHLGITNCPPALAQLIAVGISVKVRHAKRRFAQETARKRAREIDEANALHRRASR